MTKKSISNWLLCIAVCFVIINLSSCTPPASGDQYKCYYPRMRGEKHVVWQECTNNTIGSTKSSDKVSNLADECYVVVEVPLSENPDPNASTYVVKPRKGSHPLLASHSNLRAHYVGNIANNIKFVSKIDLLSSQPHPDKKDHFIINKSVVYEFAAMAYNYDARYRDLYNEAIDCHFDAWEAYGCLSIDTRVKINLHPDDACIDYNFIGGNCDYPSNKRVEHTCGVTPCFKNADPGTTEAFEPIQRVKTNLGSTIGLTDDFSNTGPDYGNEINPKIYPLLRAKNKDNTITTNYYINLSPLPSQPNDLSGEAKKVYRYVYVYVSVDQYLEHVYKAIINYPNKSVQSIDMDGKGTNEDVRYCQTTSKGERVYVVRFKLSQEGKHTLELIDKTDSESRTDGLPPIVLKRTEFFVSKSEKDESNKNHTERVLKIRPLKLRDTPMTPAAKLTVACRASLEETMNDAFSLNEKKGITAPIPKANIVTGIKCQVLEECLMPKYGDLAEDAPTNIFDSEGNMKLKVNFVSYYYDRNGRNLLSAYIQEISRRYYKNILLTSGGDNCNGSKNDYTGIIVFYAKGFVLVDGDNKLLTQEEKDKIYSFLKDPNVVLAGILGLSGPDPQFKDPYDEQAKGYANVSVGAVFKNPLVKYLSDIPGMTVDNVAATIMAHEVGHTWGDYDMSSKNNKIDGYERHKALCTGYNASKCLFNNGKTMVTAKPILKDYNTFGALWCESHQQIFLNQLTRKFIER